MTDKQDQYIEAMGKLLLLTQKGKINWNSEDPNLIQRKINDETINSVFTCIYKENNLRIYLRKNKSRGASIINPMDVNWNSEVILEITDINGNSIWQFPKESILRDLMEAVRYKTSGAHDLIQSLLSDESDDLSDLI